jgi:hypothetical protein
MQKNAAPPERNDGSAVMHTFMHTLKNLVLLFFYSCLNSLHLRLQCTASFYSRGVALLSFAGFGLQKHSRGRIPEGAEFLHTDCNYQSAHCGVSSVKLHSAARW